VELILLKPRIAFYKEAFDGILASYLDIDFGAIPGAIADLEIDGHTPN